MITTVDGSQGSRIGANRIGRLVVDNIQLEQVRLYCRFLVRPGLATVGGMKNYAFLTANPAGLAVGRKAYRVEITVLEQGRAGPLLQRALKPGLAVVGRGQQQCL